MNSEPTPKPRASAVVTAFETHGRHYESRKVDCGKINCQRCGGAGYRRASHGPYWYLCFTYRGKWYRQYLGKSLDTNKYVTEQGNLDLPALMAKRRRPRSHPAQEIHDVPGQLDALESPADSAALAREHPSPRVDLGPSIPRQDPEDLKPPPGPDPHADVRQEIRRRIRAGDAYPDDFFARQAPATPDPAEMHSLAPLSDPPHEDPDDPGPVPRDPG